MTIPASDNRSLRGQTVLVTGGAVRVGAAISRAVAAAGAKLAIHCHSHLDEAQRLVLELADLAETVVAFQADLLEVGAERRLYDAVESELGPVSVLVNNAAILAQTPLAEYDPAVAARLVDINLHAPLRLMAELARREPKSAVIINIVDAASQRSWTGHAAYVAAKAGLLQASRVAARELAPAIRVNVINPGTVVLRDDELDHVDRLLERIPLKRIGRAEDIGDAVVFLAGASYATGAVLNVDGGAGLG